MEYEQVTEKSLMESPNLTVSCKLLLAEFIEFFVFFRDLFHFREPIHSAN